MARTLGAVLGGRVRPIVRIARPSRTFLPMPKEVPIDRFFRTAQEAWVLSLFGYLRSLMEELFFRGFLYPVLVRRFGTATAVLLTSAGFGLIHAPQLGRAWGPVLVIFLVGLALTIARAATKSVAPGFLIHVAYNSTLSVAALRRNRRLPPFGEVESVAARGVTGAWPARPKSGTALSAPPGSCYLRNSCLPLVRNCLRLLAKKVLSPGGVQTFLRRHQRLLRGLPHHHARRPRRAAHRPGVSRKRSGSGDGSRKPSAA